MRKVLGLRSGQEDVNWKTKLWADPLGKDQVTAPRGSVVTAALQWTDLSLISPTVPQYHCPVLSGQICHRGRALTGLSLVGFTWGAHDFRQITLSS